MKQNFTFQTTYVTLALWLMFGTNNCYRRFVIGEGYRRFVIGGFQIVIDTPISNRREQYSSLRGTKQSPQHDIVRHILFTALIFCLLSGCVSTKTITYFQPADPKLDELITAMKPVYTPAIKPGDILSITVGSLDKEDREIFNPLSESVHQQSQIGGFVVLQPLRGFEVDTAGIIVFPQIGEIQVAGLTTKEVEIELTGRLHEYIKTPTVTVNIANYIISMLGEVARPAQYVISHNRITLPEALALAGDLTIYGKRDNVLIIREIDGVRNFARVNLTDRLLFDSPYYYLRSGDVVYVEPTRGKLTSTDRSYQLAPIIISTLSFLLLIFNTFK